MTRKRMHEIIEARKAKEAANKGRELYQGPAQYQEKDIQDIGKAVKHMFRVITKKNPFGNNYIF